MNAEKVLSSINLIVEKYNSSIAQTPEFEALAQSLREEIALAEQKKAGKADRFKAALRFSKKVNKEFAKNRPATAGAFLDDKGRQIILHPHYAVRYEKPIDGLVEAGEGNRPASIGSIFEKYDSTLEVTLPTLAELKTKLKLDKAEGKLTDEGRSLTELQGKFYNTDYLIQLIEMVEPTDAYFSSSAKFPMLVIIGEDSRGIVCPINIK